MSSAHPSNASARAERRSGAAVRSLFPPDFSVTFSSIVPFAFVLFFFFVNRLSTNPSYAPLQKRAHTASRTARPSTLVATSHHSTVLGSSERVDDGIHSSSSNATLLNRRCRERSSRPTRPPAGDKYSLLIITLKSNSIQSYSRLK